MNDYNNNNSIQSLDDQESQPLIEPTQSCFHPSKKFYRFFGLIFICLLTFGPEGCYVLPGGLEKEIEHDLKISTDEFTLFTSLYSWPNVFMCLISGILIDKILGVRLAAILFLLIITTGVYIFALGAYFNQTIIMHLGRFIFGLGGESIHVTQKALVSKWFNPNELNLVFGLLSSAALLGSSFSQLIIEPIYHYVSQSQDDYKGYQLLGIAISIGSLICVLSLFSSFILFRLDKKRDNWILSKNNRDQEENHGIKLKDVLRFPVKLWFLVLVCGVLTSAVFPFIGLAKLYFIRKYGFSSSMASLLQSLFFLITVVVSPLSGYIVDMTNHNIYWVVCSLVLGILSHGLLLFTFVSVYIPIVLLSVSLSILASSIWPMLSMIVPKNQLATAYGLMQSGLNLSLAVITLVSGFLVENNGYRNDWLLNPG